MLRRVLLIVTFLSIVGAVTPPLPAAATDATNFIQTLGNQALAVIRSNAALAQKEHYFHQVLHQDFDLSGICRFVLGPYWRTATESERQEFKSLLEAYLARFYGERFAQYNGEDLRVTGSRPSPSGEIVTSQIIRPQGPPIEVDWRLSREEGVYKIGDVVVDGVSMALTHRAEFASMIQRNGGQLAGLLTAMHAQTSEGVGTSTPPAPR
jgi:phospholipid transport system substrate-binding protein